jgi:hypothetical protein
MRTALGILSAVLFSALSFGSAVAQDKEPSLALQVVRLKPGDSQFVEIALPVEEFRPAGRSGRSSFWAERFPEQGKTGTFTAIERGKATGNDHWKASPYIVAESAELIWDNDRPGVVFRCGKDAKPASYTIRARYQNFGGKEHSIGFRFVITAAAPPATEKDKPPLDSICVDLPNFWWFRCGLDGSGSIGYGARDASGFKAGTFNFTDLARKLRESSTSAPGNDAEFVIVFRDKKGQNETAYGRGRSFVLGLFDKAFQKESASGHTDGFEKIWNDHPPSSKRIP